MSFIPKASMAGASMIKVTGISKLMSNIDKMDKMMGAKAARGLNLASVLVARESLKIVPVQIGNLKGSWFRRREGMGFQTTYHFGYTAKYAVFVHEVENATHGAAFNALHAAEIAHAKSKGLKSSTAKGGMFNRGENQQWKFLEKPIRDNKQMLLSIIYKEMKI